VSSYLEFQPVSCDTTDRNLTCVLFIDDDAITSGFGNSQSERPGSKTLTYQLDNTCPIIRMAWNASRAFGKVYSSNPAFRGNAAANPTEQQYYGIYVTSPLGADGTLLFRVRIVYNCVLTEFKTVTGS